MFGQRGDTYTMYDPLRQPADIGMGPYPDTGPPDAGMDLEYDNYPDTGKLGPSVVSRCGTRMHIDRPMVWSTSTH